MTRPSAKHVIAAAIGLMTAISLGACTKDNPLFDPGAAPCEDGDSFVKQRFTLVDPELIDILVVVDNSPGMADEQQAFAAAIPSLIDSLNDANYDWRLAVTTTDMTDPGQRGALQLGLTGSQGCPETVPRVVTRQTPDARLVAACKMIQGEQGSDFEQGFAAMRAALDLAVNGVEPNASLLRDDARLVVIFLSDEDDCSGPFASGDADRCTWDAAGLNNVDDYIDFLLGVVKPAPLRGQPVLIIPVVGPRDPRAVEAPQRPTPVCSGVDNAQGGNRYRDLAAAAATELHADGRAWSICEHSFDDAIAEMFSDIIHVGADTLCAGRRMNGEVVDVRLLEDDSVNAAAIETLSSFGDFISLGAIENCDTGAVAVSTESHGADSSNVVEVRFCTDATVQ